MVVSGSGYVLRAHSHARSHVEELGPPAREGNCPLPNRGKGSRADFYLLHNLLSSLSGELETEKQTLG